LVALDTGSNAHPVHTAAGFSMAVRVSGAGDAAVPDMSLKISILP
jgi:hypothetical protein